MKRISLSIAIIFTFFNCFSQEKKLLENYKFRVNTYQGLSLNLLADGISSKSNIDNQSNSFSANTNANYFKIKSTNNFYQLITASLNSSYGYSTTNNIFSDNSSKGFSFLPSLNFDKKRYFKDNFIELGTSISNQYGYSKIRNRGIEEIIYTKGENNFNPSILIGIGKGRLENITDMQNALWLVRALQSDESFSRKLTENETIDLAKTITKSINYRILDGRQKVKYILNKVDAYLQSIGVVKQHSIDYFTNLNDVLFFANNYSRQAGLEKFAKLNIQYANDISRSEQNFPFFKNKLENNFTEIKLRIGFQKYKPIRLTSQLDYGFAGHGIVSKNNNTSTNYNPTSIDFENTIENNNTRIGIDYFIKYSLYPNTRTNLSFNLIGENSKYITEKNAALYHNMNAFINVNYFINYNTTLFANTGYTFFQNIYDYNTYSGYNNRQSQLYFNTGIKLNF